MIRLNFFVVVGALLVLAGAFMAGAEIVTGGLTSSVDVFGATIPSLLSVILGVALIKIGTRSRGLARRK